MKTNQENEKILRLMEGEMIEFGYFAVHESRIDEWQHAYPTLNVRGEMDRMVVWLKANPRRAKKKLWMRFITGWLARENAKVERQAIEARSYARVGQYETAHATPERAQEVLDMIERQRAQKSTD